MEPTPTQYCPRCELSLPQDLYPVSHWGRPGNYCRECNRAYMRAYKAARWVPPKLCSYEPCATRTRSGREYCTRHGRNVEKYGQPVRPVSETYQAVHKRLDRWRGKATNYSCIGCSVKADNWSYDHADEDERVEVRNGRTYVYSINLDHYHPMCFGCHTRLDHSVAA